MISVSIACLAQLRTQPFTTCWTFAPLQPLRRDSLSNDCIPTGCDQLTALTDEHVHNAALNEHVT